MIGWGGVLKLGDFGCAAFKDATAGWQMHTVAVECAARAPEHICAGVWDRALPRA